MYVLAFLQVTILNERDEGDGEEISSSFFSEDVTICLYLRPSHTQSIDCRTREI